MFPIHFTGTALGVLKSAFGRKCKVHGSNIWQYEYENFYINSIIMGNQCGVFTYGVYRCGGWYTAFHTDFCNIIVENCWDIFIHTDSLFKALLFQVQCYHTLFHIFLLLLCNLYCQRDECEGRWPLKTLNRVSSGPIDKADPRLGGIWMLNVLYEQ